MLLYVEIFFRIFAMFEFSLSQIVKNGRNSQNFVNEGTRTPGTFVEYFDNCLFCCTISKIAGLDDLSLCEK